MLNALAFRGLLSTFFTASITRLGLSTDVTWTTAGLLLTLFAGFRAHFSLVNNFADWAKLRTAIVGMNSNFRTVFALVIARTWDAALSTLIARVAFPIRTGVIHLVNEATAIFLRAFYVSQVICVVSS